MFNIQSMMKQAQEMQEKLQRVQAEAELMLVESSGAGGLIKVTMTCKHKIQSLSIDPSLLSDREMLEDLLKVTLNDANEKADEKMSEAAAAAMGPMAGKMKLPF